MLDEAGGRLLRAFANRFVGELVVPEHRVAAKFLSFGFRDGSPSSEPMRQDLGNPLRPFLAERVEQAPKRAVDGDRSTRLGECVRVVDTPQHTKWYAHT